jgi:hypothetical protein
MLITEKDIGKDIGKYYIVTKDIGSLFNKEDIVRLVAIHNDNYLFFQILNRIGSNESFRWNYWDVESLKQKFKKFNNYKEARYNYITISKYKDFLISSFKPINLLY